jgi:hypothetical protein
MSKSSAQAEETIIIPLWVFFASGYKWMGGFVAGCLGWYIIQLITTEPLWASLVTAILTFVGWTAGTFLDINTYLNERKFKFG